LTRPTANVLAEAAMAAPAAVVKTDVKTDVKS
jgi:hypothetical protein